MGKTLQGGTDLLMEHDHNSRVGTVHASWEGRDGSLRVIGMVNDPKAALAVRNGSMRGLSLGTGVIQKMDGTALLRTQDELSLCEEPRRAGCFIDSIDGRPVRSVAVFSNSNRKCHR